jgi:hypothetical protein
MRTIDYAICPLMLPFGYVMTSQRWKGRLDRLRRARNRNSPFHQPPLKAATVSDHFSRANTRDRLPRSHTAVITGLSRRAALKWHGSEVPNSYSTKIRPENQSRARTHSQEQRETAQVGAMPMRRTRHKLPRFPTSLPPSDWLCIAGKVMVKPMMKNERGLECAPAGGQ